MLTTESGVSLNFVVTGQVRCGASVVQTSVNTHPEATCHGDLLHHDDATRKKTHETYFGPPTAAWPEHCDHESNPEQYLSTQIFDNPLKGERVIGTKILLPHICRLDLWEYLGDRCRDGDFCLILVRRNPLACYVSCKQAQQSGIYHRAINDHLRMDCPSPVDIDADELVRFVRSHRAAEERIRAFCDDRLEIDYREIFLDYHRVMEEIFRFLELPPYPHVTPGVRRLKNLDMRQRIANFAAARLRVDEDMRDLFDAHDLF